jgi:hypothetical protein
VAYGPGQAYPPQPALPSLPAGTGPEGGWLGGMGPASMGPMVSPSWLAATADRERTVGVLRAGFVEGRLSQDELDDRIARAYSARTYADLWSLTTDLPAGALPYPQAHLYLQAQPYPQAQAHPQALPYPPGAMFPPGYEPGPDPVVPPAAAARSRQSGAALLILAMVIFTLAALITAIVTAHAQTGMLTPAQPPVMNTVPYQRPVVLLPEVSQSIPAEPRQVIAVPGGPRAKA